MSFKPIRGSWFEFQHHNKPEGVPWNGACAAFTAGQWAEKVREMAAIGFEYAVLMAVALDGMAYYETELLPAHNLACPDPIEAVLAAADECGIRFFLGNDWFGVWTETEHNITDAGCMRRRLQAMEELAARYGHHRSFHGWYYPDELCVNPYYSEAFIRYVNSCSVVARQLTPGAKVLIAPYGTRLLRADDTFVRQLDAMDVDFVAYQDEIGVRKSAVEETPRFYEALRRAHDRAGRAALWADIEIFEFEGEVYKSALVPAAFERVRRQLEAVSPFVDTILVYQYLGIMNPPGSTAFAGHPGSTRLYEDYVRAVGAAK